MFFLLFFDEFLFFLFYSIEDISKTIHICQGIESIVE